MPKGKHTYGPNRVPGLGQARVAPYNSTGRGGLGMGRGAATPLSRGVPIQNPLASAVHPVPASAVSEYRRFLNDHIVNKAPANFSPAHINGWPEPDVTTPQGKIQDEIARKFNTTNRLGVQAVSAKNSGSSLASYWGNGASFEFPFVSNPTTSTVGHELIHANDHQYDNLNARGWEHLRRLHDDNDLNSQKFKDSVTKIQNKINPVGEFSKGYGSDLQRSNIVNDINAWKSNNNLSPAFAPAKWGQAKNIDNWTTTFNQIPQVVTHYDPATRVQNKPFFLGGPSEFPAFMSERLTERWRPNENTSMGHTPDNTLSINEARFLHSTLGDMGMAYPNALPGGAPGSGYPTMNSHIMARRKSIEDAYPGVFIGSDDRKEDSYSPSSSSSSSSSSYLPFSSSFPSLSSSSSSGGSYGGPSSSLPYYDSGRSSSSDSTSNSSSLSSSPFSSFSFPSSSSSSSSLPSSFSYSSPAASSNSSSSSSIPLDFRTAADRGDFRPVETRYSPGDYDLSDDEKGHASGGRVMVSKTQRGGHKRYGLSDFMAKLNSPKEVNFLTKLIRNA
jgi:hypothetical protein